MHTIAEPDRRLVDLALSPDLKSLQSIHQARTGKRMHPSVLQRWVRKGVRGVTILAVLRGKQWFTTEEEYAKFQAVQTQIVLQGPSDFRNVTDAELRAKGLL